MVRAEAYGCGLLAKFRATYGVEELGAVAEKYGCSRNGIPEDVAVAAQRGAGGSRWRTQSA